MNSSFQDKNLSRKTSYLLHLLLCLWTAAAFPYFTSAAIADTLVQEAYIRASNQGSNDYFGVLDSIAMDGDTLVIGAPYEDSSATGVNGDEHDDSARDAGAAYVFVRNEESEWRQQAYLKASNAGAGDLFGQSVAIHGDIVVVGATGEESSATEVNGEQSDNSNRFSGATYLFIRDEESNWSQLAYLKA